MLQSGRESGRLSLYAADQSERPAKRGSFCCSFGMEIFHYPIYFDEVFLGYIQSGYIRHSVTGKGKIKNVYDVPESVIAGIKALIRRIVKAVRNFCEFEQFRRELMEKELRIASQEETQRILLKNLKDTQYAVTDLKINHHFLFNTPEQAWHPWLWTEV